LLSTEAAKKAGLDVEKGSAVIGKLEFEGGVALEKVKTRVETPFQIEGMNSMGLPGMELHGMLGYTVLAKYRIAIDLERERMRWTPLDFEPPGFDRLKLKDGGGNIELLGAMLKILSRLSGLKPAPPAEARGMLGLRLETEDGRVKVAQVLEGSPAAEAGLKPGAVIESINGRNVASVEQALRAVAEVRPGDAVTVETKNGDAKASVKIKAASGF
jgi:membrane-associated protease RseP (regulator of RpoE activity)